LIQLTETHLPEEFVRLLLEQKKIQSEASKNSSTSISDFKSVEMLALRSMKEFYQGHSTLQGIIQTLGWNHFRDRLASVYVKKILDGKYPHQTDLKTISDISSLDEELMKYSISGTPRSFLISFYFKLQAIESKAENGLISDLPYYEKILESIELLKFIKVKVLKIDWLLLQLLHFSLYLPKKEIEDAIKECSYDSLYNKLTAPQKSSYANNLLSYGFAINDHDSLAPAKEAI